MNIIIIAFLLKIIKNEFKILKTIDMSSTLTLRKQKKLKLKLNKINEQHNDFLEIYL